MKKIRKSELSRKTGETDLKIILNLDGTGEAKINTGYKFLDHMLTLFTWFGRFDIEIISKTDMKVQPDDHHLVEDVAIVFGKCFRQAIGEISWGKVQGLTRFASTVIPMDESLALTAVDIYERGLAVLNIPLKRENIGDISGEMITHFLETFAQEAKIVLHVKTLTKGKNDHHLLEAVFKSLGKTIYAATRIDPRLLKKVPGSIDD